MTAQELRQNFLEFMKSKGHTIIPSASLVPENDPTTLFTGSGMQPMVPYLLGEKHPGGTRIADSQKCFRSVDIEEVGDNRHTTFFEMLGNWSLGDYFKKEQIGWMLEFLTEEIGLDPKKLYVTVFIGDEKNNIPKDTEAATIWQDLFKQKGIEAKAVEIGSEENGYKVGMQGGRIFYYDVKKNWWSRTGVPDNMPAGEPGGPDSEMFYDFGISHDLKFGKECHPNCDCGRFLEIGNNVFMEYLKNDDNTFAKLPQQNVDFGGGLERIMMAVKNCPDIIEINHRSILDYIEKVSGRVCGEKKEETRAFRIIADHVKASAFLIGDGVNPSNTDQGYYVRRLIRRAVRYWDKLGVKESEFSTLVDSVLNPYKDSYPDTYNKKEIIIEKIKREENKFRKTLEQGLKEFNKLTSVSGKDAFNLYQTYGFPLEMTEELAKEKNIQINKEEFEKEFKKHQDLSRTASAGMFKGGLADASEETKKLHTAAHLLLAALRKVLGDHIFQKGSNITAERLRFDFSHPEKMTDEQKQEVEKIVNDIIQKDLLVVCEEMSLGEAKKQGAMGVFESKYGEKVKVYTIAPRGGGEIFSKEICGGPHVARTGELGKLKIQKEESSSAGVRRIKAILK